MVALPVEGALAPDPRPRVEPLREIPGLRKKERTWKDEVRERVRDRRRSRAGAGLPLFDEAPEGDPLPPGGADEAPDAGEAADVHPPGLADTRLGEVDDMPAPRTMQLDDEEPALALRPEPHLEPEKEAAPPAVTPLRGRARVAPLEGQAPAVEARRDVETPAPREPEWDLGPGAAPAPPGAVERPAYVFERFQAAVVDVALLAGLSAVVLYFAGRAAHVDLPRLLPAWPWLAAFLAFLALNYAAYFTGTTGQTLGKMLAGLRVVDVADGRTGYARAMARAAAGALGTALLVGVVPMFLDPARRGLHDRLLGTRVIKR
jgi:uncharacterized RDD family membrane protein YckC